MINSGNSIGRSGEDSVLLVAGGTSGTGLATAKAFARDGVKRICILGRNAERGALASAELKSLYADVDVHFISADANDPVQACAAAAEVDAKFGAIDLLVNSTVGPFVPELFHLTAIDDFIPLVTQQMIAPMHMCRAVMPFMRNQRRGVIANIASDAGKMTTPGESLIGAAMAGIIMFSRTLAIEAKRDGIRVNAITPSLIEGTLAYDRTMNEGFSGKLFAKAIKLAHLGLTQPEDLADLIVFLASPSASRITGQVISVNGGISA